MLYTFIEVLRVSEFEPGVEFKEFRENLLVDIGNLMIFIFILVWENIIHILFFFIIFRFAAYRRSYYCKTIRHDN